MAKKATRAAGKTKRPKPVKAWTFQYDGYEGRADYLVFGAWPTREECLRQMGTTPDGLPPESGRAVSVWLVPTAGYRVTPIPAKKKGARRGK